MHFWARIGGTAILTMIVISVFGQPSCISAGGEMSQRDAIVIKPSPGQSPSTHRDQFPLRIAVKNAQISEIVPISGPTGLGAYAARWVKGKWKFAARLT